MPHSLSCREQVSSGSTMLHCSPRVSSYVLSALRSHCPPFSHFSQFLRHVTTVTFSTKFACPNIHANSSAVRLSLVRLRSLPMIRHSSPAGLFFPIRVAIRPAVRMTSHSMMQPPQYRLDGRLPSYPVTSAHRAFLRKSICLFVCV